MSPVATCNETTKVSPDSWVYQAHQGAAIGVTSLVAGHWIYTFVRAPLSAIDLLLMSSADARAGLGRAHFGRLLGRGGDAGAGLCPRLVA